MSYFRENKIIYFQKKKNSSGGGPVSIIRNVDLLELTASTIQVPKYRASIHEA